MPKINEVWSRKKLSIAKVEYVVKAPRKPVVKKALVSGEKFCKVKAAKATPIRKDPNRLTANMP